MQYQGHPPAKTKQLVERIFTSRKITRADQHLFMSSLLSKSVISEEERCLINRVSEGVQRGLLRVVD